MPKKTIKVDEKKFMWDGGTYSTEEEANERTEQYETKGFEVVCIIEEGMPLLYTRRTVTEIVLEEGGQPL